MERKALAFRAMMKKHGPKKENLDPRNWLKLDSVRGFADFVLNKHVDKDADGSFDHKEMCE